MKEKQGCIKGNMYNIHSKGKLLPHYIFRGLTMAGKENFTSGKLNIRPAVIFQHVCICRNMLSLTHLVKIVCEIIFKKSNLIQSYNWINHLFISEMQLDELHLPKLRNQVWIARSVFQGYRLAEVVLVVHRHSYTPNLPKSACRYSPEGSERPPVGRKGGRVWVLPLFTIIHRMKCI